MKACRYNKEPVDKKDMYTVIVLHGDQVIHNHTYSKCGIRQTRNVVPFYRMGDANWGYVDSLKVVPNSECVTICASGDMVTSIAAGKHDINKAICDPGGNSEGV